MVYYHNSSYHHNIIEVLLGTCLSLDGFPCYWFSYFSHHFEGQWYQTFYCNSHHPFQFTINGERFARLNFCSFLEHHESLNNKHCWPRYSDNIPVKNFIGLKPQMFGPVNLSPFKVIANQACYAFQHVLSYFHSKKEMSNLIPPVSAHNNIFMYKLLYLLTSKMADFLLLTWLQTNYCIIHKNSIAQNFGSDRFGSSWPICLLTFYLQ